MERIKKRIRKVVPQMGNARKETFTVEVVVVSSEFNSKTLGPSC